MGGFPFLVIRWILLDKFAYMPLAFLFGGILFMNPSTGVLTIDLSAVEENWWRVNRQLHGQARASAVIKANAYGLGADRIGPFLYALGCREFFVATLEEALAARCYLPLEAVIYVLSGARAGSEALFIQQSLIPVLSSLPAVERWRQVCGQKNLLGPCAIKVDTGMTRLGLDAIDFVTLCSAINGFESLDVVLVMSHLACADEPEHSLNRYQLEAFQKVVVAARKSLPRARFSLANSSGVFLGAEWHFDLVRSGAALYGINPQPRAKSVVLPVINLRLPVIQVRTIKQPVTLGYGASASLDSGARVLVVAGGYADGLHRTIGRKGVGALNATLLPVIGRISMDTTIFDASALSEEDVVEGLMIEVCNDKLTVDHLAEEAGALGYEVLTSLSSRYQRLYLPSSNSKVELS